jgi:hypothetical protein
VDIETHEREREIEINHHPYGQMVFDKGTNVGKARLTKRWWWGKFYIHMQKNELEHSPDTIHKN